MRARRPFSPIAPWLLAVCALGCDPATETDAGTPADAAPRDARTDPCAQVPGSPGDGGTCNGAPLGPVTMADTLGGPCTEDPADEAGSCMNLSRATDALCVPDPLGQARCTYLCEPASTFVSTSGCPTGSRCFTLSRTFAQCFRNCRTDADCEVFEECDSEASCVLRPFDAGPRPIDAGPFDGAVDIDAGPDGGV